MTCLLDTAPFLWALLEPARLSPAARRVLENRAHSVMVSSASLWEVVVKAQKGQLPIDRPVSWLEAGLRALGADALPIRAAHIYFLAGLPPIHKDPFDRILVAQASVENWPLITSDAMIRRYAVRTIW